MIGFNVKIDRNMPGASVLFAVLFAAAILFNIGFGAILIPWAINFWILFAGGTLLFPWWGGILVTLLFPNKISDILWIFVLGTWIASFFLK